MINNELIGQEAISNLERLINKVASLESNDYYRPVQRTGATSNPPSQAEITALFGTPASFNSEMVGLLKDTTNGRSWIVFGDRVSWYYVRAYNTGSFFVPFVNETTITTTAAFVNGMFTIPSVPTNATGAIISVSFASSSTGTYVQVRPSLASTGNFLYVLTQANNVTNSGYGTVPTTGNQVYCYRSGALLGVTIACSGYFI